MDEAALRQFLTSAEGVEFAPTDEMMMMNSTAGNNDDALDLDIPGLIIQSQQSQESSARANTSVVESTRTATTAANNDDDDNNDLLLEDETILERIIALQEMFPESVQNAIGALNRAVINGSKFTFSKGRTVAWWLTSTMCVLVFPILVQKELLQVAEQISREQRSILLGPQAATGAINGAAF